MQPEWRSRPEFDELLAKAPPVPELVGLSELPAEAPTVLAEEELAILRRAPSLYNVFAYGWPFKWIWAPILYVQMPGEHSRLSGVYVLHTVERWSPRWLRAGEGRVATFAYLYDLGAEQWAWKAEMGPGGDDEQIDGASETVAKAVPRKEGKVFRAVPQWQSEVVIKRTSPSSESRGKVRDRYDGVLALQDNFYIEGMPVYSAVAGDEDILWLFSYDGRWIFARSSAGPMLYELAETGFFDRPSKFTEQWLYRSRPHEGHGPDVDWEPAAGRDTLEVWAPALAQPDSLLEGPTPRVRGSPSSGARPPAEVVVQATYVCSAE